MIFILLAICALFPLSNGAAELLKNPDFESTSFSGNWVCNGCTLSSSTDSFHGNRSGKVTNRANAGIGLGQTVTVSPGHTYVFSARVKLLNMAPGYMFHNVQLRIKETVNGHNKHVNVSSNPKTRRENGWVEVGFDFTVPPSLHQISVYFVIDDMRVNYVVDDASFEELLYDANWKSEANARIASLRKAPITVNFQNLHGSGYTVQIEQTGSKFAFGSVVDAAMIVDSIHHPYQQFFYDNFEWGVLGNALKWPQTEPVQGHPTLDKAVTAVNALRAKGKKVRGHNMFWGTGHTHPRWLKSLNSSEILQAMHTHINDVISRTRGTLEHWDVYNENLHGMYFEEHTGHVNITKEMFYWIHQAERGVKLFLNDYAVASPGSVTTAYKKQALMMKNAGVPIYGIGIQCHTNAHLNISVLKYRLDKVAEAGLPIWITEFTVNEPNEVLKANALEDMLTLFMSHPAVEGVLLWGYWDTRIWIHDSALASGHDVTPNEAGRRYLQLYHDTWRTNETIHVTGNYVYTSGFKGDYTLRLKRNGHSVRTQHFTLNDGGKHVNVVLP
ncbi:uncharacterized protein LOC132548855 [Ylistrum balloti]|uniref:uncharacterized protein LOC132548855 n=1 Tax=Ylistrum balloti TaxID=509963 RepID=UPI002905AD7B|nr:uncharacterized protein LOC132548855 [Ylistrum balloti]